MDIGHMTPRRPYLLRAFYDWLLENELTPHLVVDATLPGVKVPLEYVQDGQIILNVAPRAVGNLELGNDEVTFNARFGGRVLIWLSCLFMLCRPFMPVKMAQALCLSRSLLI